MEDTGRKAGRSGGYRRRLGAWTAWARSPAVGDLGWAAHWPRQHVVATRDADELQLIGSLAREREVVGGRRERVRGKRKEKTNFKIKFLKNYNFATNFFDPLLSHRDSDLSVTHVHELILTSTVQGYRSLKKKFKPNKKPTLKTNKNSKILTSSQN